MDINKSKILKEHTKYDLLLLLELLIYVTRPILNCFNKSLLSETLVINGEKN